MGKIRKHSDFIKEIYFNGCFVPYNMIAFTDNSNTIKEKIKDWCKTHKLEYSEVIGFKSCGTYYKIKQGMKKLIFGIAYLTLVFITMFYAVELMNQ